jgi:hypothetical protein
VNPIRSCEKIAVFEPARTIPVPRLQRVHEKVRSWQAQNPLQAMLSLFNPAVSLAVFEQIPGHNTSSTIGLKQ